MASETEHKQVRVRANGREANVDEKLAPLIREIWRADIDTHMSCQQGAYDRVWLNFRNPDDASDFMDVVIAEYDTSPDSVYRRALGMDTHDKNWIYGLLPEDHRLVAVIYGDTVEDEFVPGPPSSTFHVSVWFPPSDLPAVLKKFKDLNKK